MTSPTDKHWRECSERCFAMTEEERCVDCPSRLPQAQPKEKATVSPYDLNGLPEYPGE